MFILALYFVLLVCVRTLRGTAPPPCIPSSDYFVYVDGSLSFTQTFLNCTANIPDVSVFPTYYNNKINGLVNFSVGLTLNNLVLIDEIQGTATLSFSVGLSWFDQRFAMPSFWKAIYPTKSVDLTSILQNQNVPGNFYNPQIRYPDAIDVQTVVSDITLSSKNMFVVKSAVVVTLLQSGFRFDKYPGDSQTIELRIQAYPYDNKTALMQVYGAGIYFSADASGSATYDQNQIWKYESYSVSTYSSSGASSGTSTWYGQIVMSRQSAGIVLRLVVPLFLLLLLSAITFWMATEERVNVTITIMLSVSALYIVILGNIPLVGYLTNLDKFVFWMFLLLIVVVTLHQVYATVEEKKVNFPLRIFYLRCIEAVGRIFLMPLIVSYFAQSIPFGGANAAQTVMFTAIAIAIVVGCRESIGVRDKLYKSLTALVEKINNDTTTIEDISPVEFFVINIWKFRKYSTSPEYLSELVATGRRLKTDFHASVKLQDLKRTLQGESNGASPRKSTQEFGERVSMDGAIQMTELSSPSSASTATLSLPERVFSGRIRSAHSDADASGSSGVFNPIILEEGKLSMDHRLSAANHEETFQNRGSFTHSVSLSNTVNIDSEDERET